MCGIFAITVSDQANIKKQDLISIIDELFRLSESRGKEASGLAISTNGRIEIYKDAISASDMIRRRSYREWLTQILSNGQNNGMSNPIAIIGHSRLVTNGSMETHDNNQQLLQMI